MITLYVGGGGDNNRYVGGGDRGSEDKDEYAGDGGSDALFSSGSDTDERIRGEDVDKN